ncbi:MAG TPA: hypothetical protein VHM19_01920, partial [Polyangiales bacterium]|nr:hypothetical protein [Polyangiales bacterium]
MNLVRVALAPLWLASRLFARPKSPWVELRLASRLRELKTPAPLWQRVLPQAQRRLAATSLEDVRDLVRMMAGDASVQGLLVHLPSLEAGWAACESLRQAFSSLRSAGKQVICYLPEGAGSRELYVALAGQRIAVSPHS